MRFILFLVISLLFIPATAQAGEPTILVFGDSLVAGYGLKKTEALPAQLQANLQQYGIHATVINGGVSGDTTAGGRNRLAWTLKKYNPDIVILALGANDMLRGLPPATTRENLDAMLQELSSDQNRRIILSAVVVPDNLGPSYRDEFNRIYPDLAQKYNAALYPFLLEGIYGRADLMLPDGAHPSARGAEAMAEALSQYLRLHYLKPSS